MDGVNNLLVGALGFRILNMREGPFEREMEVGESGSELSANVVEGCGGVKVGAIAKSGSQLSGTSLSCCL